MRKAWLIRLSVLVVAALALGSAVAHAQSAIAGVVRDTTGAVLPGVTVEAASPALIEKVRSVISDDQGQYRVVDLRPGAYVVTFTLPGFSTVRREGINLEANFTANVNVELRVGALEETVTVSGEAPTVDIQTTQQRAVLDRELLDALPAARNFATNTVPAIVRAPDVGGSRTMQHANMSVYGLNEAQDLQIDGIGVMGASRQPGIYINYGTSEEVVYQVGGGSAESAGGGVTVNLIPRQGGNDLKGDVFGMFANKSFQSSNYSDELRNAGLELPESLWRQWDVNVSVGGPIKRDKLWFFSSWRDWAYNEYVANQFDPVTGKQGVYDNHLYGAMTRLTFQADQRNKLTAMYDRLHKNQGHLGIEDGNTAPDAARISTTPTPYIAQAKWTSTLSSKLLVESGFSANMYTRWQKYEPEVARATCGVAFNACPAGTNYGGIAKQDLVTGRIWNAAPNGMQNTYLPVYAVNSAVSYVTGSHSIKVGEQWRWGWVSTRTAPLDLHGHLVQRYRNGVPDSVDVKNTPVIPQTDLDLELGLFVQDSWTIRRLTLNPGLRYDILRASVPEQSSPAGRFVPARTFAAIPNIIDWTGVSPRIGAAYDLFGDGRTALKASVGKYMTLASATTAAKYNPLLLSTDTRTWNDLNRDDIAQENELGPPTNNAFGVRRNVNPDPDLKWPSTWLTSIGVQRELMTGVGLLVTYTRRTFQEQLWTDNLATTHADYALVTIADPRGNGQTLPVYNLNVNRRGLVNELDTNSGQNKRTYAGVDVSVNARLGRGGTVTLGSSTGRVSTVTCEVDDPNALRFCDQTQLDIPFRTTVRASGMYPLPYGIRFSAVFQSIATDDKPLTYSVGRAIIPNLTATSVTVRLNEPGSEYYDRINQLDFVVGKEFRTGRLRWQPKLELWNVLNANPVLSEVTIFGSSRGLPTDVLPARMARVAVQVNF